MIKNKNSHVAIMKLVYSKVNISSCHLLTGTFLDIFSLPHPFYTEINLTVTALILSFESP